MHESSEVVERLRKSWRKAWNFNYRGWNFFEAVVSDDLGNCYVLSLGAMGNKFLSISTAWFAVEDKWHFINKNFFNQVRHFSEKWCTADGHIESYFDPECGFEVIADSAEGRADLRFIPNPHYNILNKIKNKQADFELLLLNHCEVKGYLTIEGEKKRVSGIGSVEHFYGRFAERIHWDYFSLKSQEASIYYRTGTTEKECISSTVAIYTPEKVYLMREPITKWEALDNNQVLATASQEDRELKVKLDLYLKNPENDRQPYINFRLPPFKRIYANVHEWCANIDAQFIDKGHIQEFSGKGICHLTEANW